MQHNFTIWISGASSGLGAALAIEYAATGRRLILSGRNIQALQIVANECSEKGAEIQLFAFDHSNFESIKNAIEQHKNEIGSIDLLINNVGIGQRAPALEANGEVERQILDVNFWSAVWLTKALQPFLTKQKLAQIAVISSISGLYGFYLRSAYSAAKHALIGYFEALSLELKHSNITVSIICPGRINTGFPQRALLANGNNLGSSAVAHKRAISVVNAAKKIKCAIDKKKRFYAFGTTEILLWYIKRIHYTLFYYIASKLPSNS